MVSKIHLNLGKLENYSIEEQRNIVTHEMIHSLAFFKTLYGNYIDENGKYRGYHDVVKIVEDKDKK